MNAFMAIYFAMSANPLAAMHFQNTLFIADPYRL
jgi:hypothetical protein